MRLIRLIEEGNARLRPLKLIDVNENGDRTPAVAFRHELYSKFIQSVSPHNLVSIKFYHLASPFGTTLMLIFTSHGVSSV